MAQYGTANRTAMAQAFADRIAGGTIFLYAEDVPATAAGADPATVVASGSLPSPAATASGGAASRTGTWAVTGQAGAGAGTVARSYRIKGSGSVVEDQGSVTIAGGIVASCTLTAGNATIAAPANSIPNGANVTGAGVQVGTYVVSGGGTASIVLSAAPLVGGSGVSLTFIGDLTMDNPNIANGQAGAVGSYSVTLGGASR